MIRVVLADDHHVMRSGIRTLLEEEADDIKVVGEAGDGQEAVELVERLVPDVLVIDISMPRLNGTEATERVRALNVPTQVVILSMYDDEALVRQALRHGAKGYLLKRSVTEELLLAIRAASRGESYLSPTVSSVLVDAYLNQRDDSGEYSPLDQLTPREREVMQLIVEGHTNNQIANMLNISAKTVARHRANLMSKLDVHDVRELMRVAIRYGLVLVER